MAKPLSPNGSTHVLLLVAPWPDYLRAHWPYVCVALPPRGPRGSLVNRERERLARELVRVLRYQWLREALVIRSRL